MSNNQMVLAPRELMERLDLGKNTALAMAALPELRELLARPAEQHQHAMVGEVVAFGEGLHEIAWAAGRMPKLGAKLYTHADPAEVERLKLEIEQLRLSLTLNDAASIQDDCVRTENRTLAAEVERLRKEVARKTHCYQVERAKGTELRAKLAEAHALLQKTAAAVREYAGDYSSDHAEHWQLHGLADEAQALSASAEPSASVERDELTRMVDAAMLEMSNIHPPLGRGECARLIRAALERKP